MSYKTLEHATDAIIEVTADSFKEAFQIAGISVIDTILDSRLLCKKTLETMAYATLSIQGAHFVMKKR